MGSSQNKMIAQLFKKTSVQKAKQVHSTIAFRFRKQLKDLIDRLERYLLYDLLLASLFLLC